MEWFSTGHKGLAGEWDGAAWTGRSRPDTGETPKWHVKAFAFFAHPWFWLLVAGLVLVAVAGILGNQSIADGWWQALVVVGMIPAMLAMVAIFWPLLRFGELPHLRLTIVMGLVSGGFAAGAALLLEAYLEPALGAPLWADLWLAGPVEETMKLAVPFLLLVLARRVFGDPRTGVLLVLLSGVVFGVAEGFEYVAGASGTNGPLVAGLIRGFGELTHSLWPAIAASLIWLAAHRAGRAITWAGFVGWVIAMAFHSIHDGIAAGGKTGTHNDAAAAGFSSMSEVVTVVVFLNLFTLVAYVIAFVVLRHVLRELVPPTAVASNPPRWRPRLTQWGVPRHDRAGEREAVASAP